jgi:hypothetical protein
MGVWEYGSETLTNKNLKYKSSFLYIDVNWSDFNSDRDLL